MAKQRCDTFWGTHGCDLKTDHDGAHECDCGSITTDGWFDGYHYELFSLTKEGKYPQMGQR